MHGQPNIKICSAKQAKQIFQSPSLAVAQDSHLQRVTIPEAAYVKFASLISWWWAGCARSK